LIDRVGQELPYQRKTHGTAILLVEQNVLFAITVADRYAVLKLGEIIDCGSVEDVGAQENIMRHLSV
jgi:ABC-type branched-subunit amino acid transport system ATPase component